MKYKIMSFFVVTMMGLVAYQAFPMTEEASSDSHTSEQTTSTNSEQNETEIVEEETATVEIEETAVLSGELTLELVEEEASEAFIEDVPHIAQLPELARGCEVTSLAMMLQYAGVNVDKMTLAEQITTVPFKYSNGLRGNPNDGFVGDIYTFDKSGYGVYHAPIAALAETYLPGRVVDLTGQSIDSVYKQVQDGSPVLVITNATFATLPESEFSTWNTPSGTVQITYREHSVLVVGYDETTVYINDPLAEEGYRAINRTSFEEAWVQMGSQAVSYQ